MDTTKEFMKGAMLGYIQSRSPIEVAELFSDAFDNIDNDKASDITLCLIRLYFEKFNKR